MSDNQQKPEVQPAPERPRPSVSLTTPVGSNLAFQPRSFGELIEFAKMVASSKMTPEAYEGNPGAVLVAIQMGAEVGLGPMAAIQNIAVINGRPSVWGDAGLAIVKTHPDFVSITEDIRDDGTTVTIKRRNEPDVTRTFTRADAKDANLLDKKGPWQNYPKRMMQMRARWLAMRDQFPDALRGISSAEESQDIVQIVPAASSVQSSKGLDEVVKAQRPALVASPTQTGPAPKAETSAAQPVQTLDDVVTAKSKPAPQRRDDEPPHPAESKAGF